MRLPLAFAILLLAPLPVRADPMKPAPKPLTAAQQLDQLFANLAKAQSEEDADPIHSQIEAMFLQSGSPTVDLLMTRSQGALKSGDTGTARKVIDAVTKL